MTKIEELRSQMEHCHRQLSRIRMQLIMYLAVAAALIGAIWGFSLVIANPNSGDMPPMFAYAHFLFRAGTSCAAVACLGLLLSKEDSDGK